MQLWLVQYVDFDGGYQGKTCSLKLFFTKEKAQAHANALMEHKGWPDQVWKPTAEWIDERERLDTAWDRWSNNKDRMVILLRPITVED